YYDIYPSLVASSLSYPLEQAKKMVLDSVKPLGERYVAAMAKGFDNRWMDTYPRPHKQSGAHMAGSAYDVHPYVLMNYNDNYESVSGKRLSEMYGEILRRYHGEREGVVKIDELYTVEWAYIPHFYYTFYVFQYATSIAASSLLADAVLKGEPGARERYLKLISAGGSDYPYELVKAAGVDLASP